MSTITNFGEAVERRKARRVTLSAGLLQDLVDSNVEADRAKAEMDRKKAEFRCTEADRARAMITAGLSLLREHTSADEAISYLENTLLAVKG